MHAGPRRSWLRLIRTATATAAAGLLMVAVLPTGASAATHTDYSDVVIRATAVQRDLESGNFLTIGDDRRGLAEVVAPLTGVEAWQLEDAWATADPRRQAVIYTALAQLNHDYVTNGETPTVGFDCSGLTKYSWAAAGITLEHQSEAQMKQGEVRTYASALPGDLLHYPGHIGLFLGAGRAMVHAVNHATNLAIGIATENTLDVRSPLN
jgi:peptidoglycan DL-endopeptidase CwlO